MSKSRLPDQPSPHHPDAPVRRGIGRLTGHAGLAAAGLAAVATILSATLPWGDSGPFSAAGSAYAEWFLYLFAVQLLAMPVILFACGFPNGWKGWLVFLLANLEMLAVSLLMQRFLFHAALFHAAQVLLRLAIVALWGFAVLGAPIVFRHLKDRRRNRRTDRPFLLGRLWFASVFFLLLIESGSALILRLDRQANRLVFPETFETPTKGELRIAAIGESTMAGFPYNGRFGIPEVVAWQLRQMYPDHRIVVENLGRDGLNLRKALLTLNDLKTRPHLLMMYSGHNEYFYDLEETWTDVDFSWERYDAWLDWSPTFRLFDRNLLRAESKRDLEGDYQRHLVDRNIATTKMRQVRLERFRRQLEQLAEWSGQVDVPMLWFVPAGSEADFEPNRSYLSYEPTAADREEIERMARQGRELSSAGKWDEAAALYRDALQQFDGFAEFHFQLAECLVHAGRFDEARVHYSRALDQDGQPIRMTGVYRRQVQEVAAEYNIPTVDAADVLRPRTPQGILGRSVFVDYVHPNLEAYYSLGMAVIERIDQVGLLRRSVGDPVTPKETGFQQAVAAVALTAMDLADAYLRVAMADELQRRLRYESSRLERESRQYRQWSQQLQSGEISPGENGTEPLGISQEEPSVPEGRTEG